MNDRDIEALFPFYALGTLSDEERDLVERYVSKRPAARAELNEMVEATAELAFLAEPEAGTAAEKAALMRRIRNERTTGRVKPAASRTVGFLDALRRLFAPRPLPALAVLSLLLIVLLGWSLSLRARMGDLNERIAALENDVAALDAERSALQTATDDLAAENAALREQVQSQQQLLAALGRPDTVTVAVNGTEDEPGASGALVLRTDNGQALLAVSGLAPLGAGQDYQLWLIRGDQPISAGVFAVNDVGPSTYSFPVDTTAVDFDAVGVSIEPEGGSPQPTGAIVLFGSRSS